MFYEQLREVVPAARSKENESENIIPTELQMKKPCQCLYAELKTEEVSKVESEVKSKVFKESTKVKCLKSQLIIAPLIDDLLYLYHKIK